MLWDPEPRNRILTIFTMLAFIGFVFTLFCYHYTMKIPPQLAIIGPTASGKTSLALELARQHNGIILSLDSLSVYRQIDIASAKPTIEERGDIPHYGIDILSVDKPFDVVRFMECYHVAKAQAGKTSSPLIIVGGSGFYLKILFEGLSPMPTVSDTIQNQVAKLLGDLPSAYHQLTNIDPDFARRLAPSDRYRIEKALILYYASGMVPSTYYHNHPPVPILQEELPVYELKVPREYLRERIILRTSKMLRDGLIDEVATLERQYSRMPNPMKAIGIKEVLDYFDGRYRYEEMKEKIITHTARLAKRQVTFNKSQFTSQYSGSLQELKSILRLD